MLKMFSTQLTGLLNTLHEKESFAFEDSARLLAQAAVGEGNVYLYGEKEMDAVISEALYSTEPFQSAKKWDGKDPSLSYQDRVIIFTRYTHDEQAVAAAKWLLEKNIPFVAVSTVLPVDSEADSLADLADVHIDLRLKKGLLPDEEGNRFGYPASIAALYVYYGIKLTFDEIIAEY